MTKPRCAFVLLLTALLSPSVFAAELVEVASFPTQQVTGVGVSPKSGRVFVNFPDWVDPHTLSVAELDETGKPKPFPDEAWNAKEGDPAKHFVCVQSVVVDDEDNLWILDPASPKMDGIVPGGPKLVKVDLRTNQVVQVIPFGEDVAPSSSYLNDVRIDTKTKTAYITESGIGSILVVDLQTGKTRALLKRDPVTIAENTDMMVDGIRPIDVKTGTIPTFNADGIALVPSGETLYFHSLTAHALYKVSTADLRNEALSPEELRSRVVKVANTSKPDGMLESPDGRIYLTAFEEDAIKWFEPATGRIETLVQDKKLQWPDTLAWGPDKTLYVTTSQIHRMPNNNGGVSKQEEPFRVYKIKVE